MIFVVVFILFLVVFRLLRARHGINYIIGLDIFIQIFTGSMDSSFIALLGFADWMTLIIFVNLFLFAIQKDRTYFFKFNWIDGLIFFYFLIILLIPGLINFLTYRVDLTFKYFIPIRFWLVYRNYYFFFEENNFRPLSKIKIEKILNYFLLFGMISALISISRFFDYTRLEIVENIWPVYYEGEQVTMKVWGRLSSTMSGTNGTGNFFCFLTAISLVKFDQKNIKIILYTLLFITAVFLSGSFSSIAALVIILFIHFRKKIITRSFVIVLFVCVGVYLVINETNIFRKNMTHRMETGYSGSYQKGIIPSNLVARYGYWTTFVTILSENDRILFGLGPAGFYNYEYGKNNVVNQNAESFYFRILNESGLFALIYAMFFLLFIYNKVRKKILTIENYPYQTLMKQGIIILLVAGVANETLYYGANTSLFGVFLGIIGYLNNQKYIITKQ